MSQFDNLITATFKQYHKDMIDALLNCSGCTVDCVVTLEGTKYTDCPNCKFDSINGKSANIYESGGPISFSHGVCPYCNGDGRTSSQATENVCLMAIWDSKKWIVNSPEKTANIAVQTMSKIDTYPTLKRATRLTIDSSLTPYGAPDYTRQGEPQPLGFGASNYIICSWSRA